MQRGILWLHAKGQNANYTCRLVHGHRPFWWIFDSPYHITAPRIAQFPLTCETTPGKSHALFTYAELQMMAVYMTRYLLCIF